MCEKLWSYKKWYFKFKGGGAGIEFSQFKVSHTEQASKKAIPLGNPYRQISPKDGSFVMKSDRKGDKNHDG